MKKIKIVALCISLISILTNCKKPKDFPLEPQIKFVSFTPIGDSARLRIHFTDGNGDIGLTEADTSADYKYNLFLEYHELINNVWSQVNLLIPFYYRVPLLTQKKGEALEGEIEITIKPYYYNPSLNAADTIKYSIMLKDRALNESNIEYTPVIIAP